MVVISFLRGNKVHPLMEEINKARREYGEAERMLDYADPDFIDHAIHRLNTALSQLNALIRAAKKQGLQAWTEPLQPVVTTRAENGSVENCTATNKPAE
jgi:hypothetical protein